jgi:hypothetical protein
MYQNFMMYYTSYIRTYTFYAIHFGWKIIMMRYSMSLLVSVVKPSCAHVQIVSFWNEYCLILRTQKGHAAPYILHLWRKRSIIAWASRCNLPIVSNSQIKTIEDVNIPQAHVFSWVTSPRYHSLNGDVSPAVQLAHVRDRWPNGLEKLRW